MKRIFWLHSHFLYWMGGTKLIYEILRRLHRYMPVKVFAEAYSDLARDNYSEKGIELVKTTGVTSTSPFYWLRLSHYIHENRRTLSRHATAGDILMTSMFPMNAVAAPLPNRKFQYLFEPFVFIHNTPFINNLPPAKRLFCSFLSRRYKQLDIDSTRRSEKVFTLNEMTAGSARKVYDVKAVPTYTGIDTDFFKPCDSPDLNKKYQGRRVLIHSTDFTPIKRTDLALKAVALAAKRFPEILLLITSTIPDLKGFHWLWNHVDKLGIRKNIEYLGFVSPQDISRYYSFAEILLQTGTDELAGATSFSLPVKEAMACGTPAIRNPVTDEDVEDGISGLLLDPLNTAKYAEGIVLLLSDPKKTKEMGIKAREKIVSSYCWDRTIQTILDNIS